MQEFETYFFDFDGTLVDSHDSLVKIFQGAYKAVGVDVKEDYVLRLMRISLQQGYEELKAPQDEASIQLFASEIKRLLKDDEINKLVKNYDDTKQALYILHSLGKKIAIVTSNNKRHVEEILNYLDIDKNMFSAIVGNEETKRHKPFADPILKGLELTNSKKETSCYVGDGLDDMTSAVAAGVYPILIDRLDEYGDVNHFIIKTLEELY